jgi:hypothetical protein
LKVQFCTGFFNDVRVAGLTSEKQMFDVIDDVYHLFIFAIFYLVGLAIR